MDEPEHEATSTGARHESSGIDSPAKSGLLKPKKEYYSKQDPPLGGRSAEPKGTWTSLLRESEEPWNTAHYPYLSQELPVNCTQFELPRFALPSKSDHPDPRNKDFKSVRSTHSFGPPISIVVWRSDGVAHDVEIKQNATVSELKQHVQANTGIQLDQMDLMYDGKTLGGLYGVSSEEDYLSNYGICDNDDLFVKHIGTEKGFSGLEPDFNIGHDQAQQQAEATSTDYDQDLYIVDPQSYFDELSRLERDVVQRSEYFQTKREYSLSSAVVPTDDDGDFLNELGFPAWLQRKIRRSSIVAKTLQDNDPSSGTFWQLLRSYSIVLNALRSSEQMLDQRFCADAINILVAHERVDVIEIKRIPLELITDIAKGLEMTIEHFLQTDLEETSLALNIRGLALTPFRRLFYQVGRYIPESDALSLSELLAIVSGVACFLDVALVSYVRSHGSGFDSSYFGQDLERLEINYGTRMGFRCYWVKLACLHSFLDQKRVWAFDFLDKRSDNSRPRGRKSGSSLLLARMEDLADIWGPVYNVPTGTGLIEYYRVSKGVICRAMSKKQSPIPGATLCHYFSSLSLYKLGSRRPGTGRNDLVLSKDDLLLIGAGFRENENCRYTMSTFSKECASAMTVLGTKESVWRNDNRTLAVGLSKYFGVTISGTQKLIPQTTLKQHILDKWTTKPSRSNPAILNRHLGVEISHCTGNARRVSIKELMVSKPLWPILQCQSPRWHETPWGIAFNSAMHSPRSEDIVDVWKEYASDRCEMAELVCRVLEILDATGWNEQQVFSSAVLIDNEELAVSVPKDLNTWLVALHDTHLTSAYVITTGICIECEVADQTTSICGASQAFTALQTQITAAIPKFPLTNAKYLLRPSGEWIRRIDCGSSTVVLLIPTTRLFWTEKFECSEALNRARQDPFTQDVYLRALTQSFRGRYKIKDTLLSKFSSVLTPNRDASSIDQMSAVSRHDKDPESPKHAGGNRDQHDGLQFLSEERTPTSCDLVGKSGSHSVTGESSLSICETTIGANTENRQATLQESIEPHHIIDTGADERMPTNAIKNKTRRKLTDSDLQSLNNGVRHGEMHRRTAEKSIITIGNNHEPSRMRRQPTQGKPGEIQKHTANYTFTDDDEAGADDPMTLQRMNQMPAIVGNPGGWT
ncbi:MAG: hypothetical protein Q9180_002375 [Flavoplaca navasiana]